MQKLCELDYNGLNAIVECECGDTHDGRVNIVVGDTLEVIKGIKETGRVLIIASREVDSDYVDNLHEKLAGDYEVVRFCGVGEDGYEEIEGVDVIVAVGGDRIVKRAKLLSLSYNTQLVVLPDDFNYLEYVTSYSSIEYGETKVIRPSRAPECVVVDYSILLHLDKQSWADALGGLFSKAITFFDYAYRVAVKGDGCEYIAKKAIDLIEEGIGSFDKNEENVKRFVNISIGLASLYKSCGQGVGGEEQVSDTILKFAKVRERRGVGDGEVRFLSALILSKLYDKFLDTYSRFGVWDAFSDMDKARRLLGLDELDVVKIAKDLNTEVSEYRDYKFSTKRQELKNLATRCKDILTKAHYKLVKAYPDGGYHLRYYLTSEEILGVVECAPFYSRGDTLLSFIKSSGLLTLTGA